MKTQPNRFPISPVVTTIEKSLASTPWQILRIDNLTFVTLFNSSTREILKLKFRTHAPGWLTFITQPKERAKPRATIYEAVIPGRSYAVTTGSRIPSETFDLFIEPIEELWNSTAAKTRKPSIEITHRGIHEVTARARLAFTQVEITTGRSNRKRGNIAVEFIEVNQPPNQTRHFIREPGAGQWLSVDLAAALDSGKGNPGEPLQMAVAPNEWEFITGEVDRMLLTI
jgi:hypothetical protein